MEPTQMISEEWGSLSGQYTAEEADFMTQLLAGNYSVSEKHCVNSSAAFWPGHESTKVSLTGTNSSNSYLHSISNVANSNYLCFSQKSSSSSTDSGNNIFSTKNRGTYSCETATNLDSMSQLGFCLGESKFSPHSFPCNDNLRQQINKITGEESGLEQGEPVLADNFLQAKSKYERMVFEPAQEARSMNLENPAKRLRNSFEASTNMRNIKSRKENPILASMSNNGEHRSVSLEQHGGASSSLIIGTKGPSAPNLDRRASNGAATDPQSLYARKRRERINERLRILQTLVPNGTKVDISTMLEEAVHYVKFLQLQIKLLSSDDLWMYAPIAYNGMNIGLDLTITPPTKGR